VHVESSSSYLSGISWNKTLCEVECEFINVSSFTSLLVCSTHLTLSCRILLALPTSSSFVQFSFAEILVESAWWVLFRPSWCWLFLWPLQFIRTALIGILDFWYPGPYYLMQEVLIHYFFFVFSVLCTKMHWRVHHLANTFGHLTASCVSWLVLLSELSVSLFSSTYYTRFTVTGKNEGTRS
jgi:hypothetical protein